MNEPGPLLPTGQPPVWVDSHCHLPADDVAARRSNDVEDADASSLVAEANAAGVAWMIDIGTDLASSQAATQRAKSLSGVSATAGLHPHDAIRWEEERAGLAALLEEERNSACIVAVGECGLDYHYEHSPRDQQLAAFAAQIELARRHDLALVIHSRDAWDDTFGVLADVGTPARTVFHCFTGGPDEARRALDAGAALSFSGIATFPKAPEVREAVALVPADRYLVETDAPFLAPVPNRGKPNRPAWVTLVGELIAQTRGIDAARAASETTANAAALFGLPAEASA